MTVETSGSSFSSPGVSSRVPYNPFTVKSSSPARGSPLAPRTTTTTTSQPTNPADDDPAPSAKPSPSSTAPHAPCPVWKLHDVPLVPVNSFNPVVELERGRGGDGGRERSGGSCVTAMSLCSLTAVPAYSGWSLEELRFRLYESIPQRRTWPAFEPVGEGQRQGGDVVPSASEGTGEAPFTADRFPNSPQDGPHHQQAPTHNTSSMNTKGLDSVAHGGVADHYWGNERQVEAGKGQGRSFGSDRQHEYRPDQQEATVSKGRREDTVAPGVEAPNMNTRNPLFKESNVSRILPLHCVGTWDVSETDAAEADELCLPMTPRSEPLYRAEAHPQADASPKLRSSPQSRFNGNEGSDGRRSTARSHRSSETAHSTTEADAAKWVAAQLPNCVEFTKLIEEALRSQTRQLVLERDRALEQRDLAEQRVISARMEAESEQEEKNSMREKCDSELAKMRAELDAVMADRDGVQSALERMNAEQSAALQVRKAMKDEIQDALEQSNIAEEECEQLRMRVKELEVELERERLGSARMAKELAKAQADAQQGIALKKQLAASVLHALDLSTTTYPVKEGCVEGECQETGPRQKHTSNSPGRQGQQHAKEKEEVEAATTSETKDRAEKGPKPLLGKYQPRKLMRLRRDSITPDSTVNTVKTL